MQKQDGNLKLDENKKVIKESRGFTERSLNILLKKIVDHEIKQEAITKGVPLEKLEAEANELFQQKKACPLIKSMYIRDPSKNNFEVIKFDRELLKNDPEYLA